MCILYFVCSQNKDMLIYFIIIVTFKFKTFLIIFVKCIKQDLIKIKKIRKLQLMILA